MRESAGNPEPPTGLSPFPKPNCRNELPGIQSATDHDSIRLDKSSRASRRRIVAMLTVRERPIEHVPSRTPGPLPKPISERPYERLPAATRFVQRRLVNPLRNHLLPARLVRGLLSLSRSPLVTESLIRPGGWRSMEITYRNDEPVD